MKVHDAPCSLAEARVLSELLYAPNGMLSPGELMSKTKYPAASVYTALRRLGMRGLVKSKANPDSHNPRFGALFSITYTGRKIRERFARATGFKP